MFQTWCASTQTDMLAPNVGYGGIPQSAMYSSDCEISTPVDNYTDLGYGTGQQNYTSTDGRPINNVSGFSGIRRINSNDTGANFFMNNFCKDFMTMLPVTHQPPPRILFNAKGVPEDSSAITWTFMCEYKCTLEYMPNILGFWPLDMGQMLKGWCGDNAFGFRTRPSYSLGTTSESVTANSRFSNTFFSGQDGGYAMNLENFPTFLGANFVTSQEHTNRYAHDHNMPNPYINE